ncbi:MAG TPA: DUF6531 domain-containing protein, partial [Polyangiaceae bacterium]
MSGTVIDKATDIDLPGLIAFTFRRYYSSQRHHERESSLGPGWAHTFDQRIVPRDKVLALRDEQGRYIYFERVAQGQSTFHRRERMTLTRTGELEFRVYAHQKRLSSIFAPTRPGGEAVLRRIEDSYGNAIVFEYRADRLARVVDTAGRVVNVAWRGGLIVSLSVASAGSGFVVGYEYGRDGCLVAVRDPLGHAERYEYDSLHRMTATTTLSGTKFAYEYEGDTPYCTASYGPDGLFEVHLVRDTVNRITTVDGEEPRVIAWNALGMAERVQLFDGTVLDEAAYDSDGFLIAEANGAGEGLQYWYDELGRRTRLIDPSGQVTTYEYEGDNLIREVRPDGHATRFAYDDKGSPTTVELPWGECYFQRYDERGRLVETTGPLGLLAAYEYDEQNNLVAEVDGRGARTTYRYDGLGRVIAVRDALGREMRVTRDALGQRT